MPTALELADRFRADLMRREAASTARLLNSYENVLRRLTENIGGLEAKIALLQEQGKLKPWRAQRLGAWKNTKRAIENELTRYSAVAEDEMQSHLQESVEAGLTEAEQLTFGMIPDAIRPQIIGLWQQVDPAAIESALGYFAEGSPLRTSLGKLGKSAADLWERHARDAITMSYNPRKWARMVAGSLGVIGQGDKPTPFSWILNTARTVQLNAYRQASHAAYRANSHVVKEWEWMCALDARVCLSCLAMDGTRHPLSETLNDHHAGRCLIPGQLIQTWKGLVPIENIRVGDYVRTHLNRYRRVTATSKRPYVGPVTRLGNDQGAVTVTPEHPMLTQRGWVSARAVSASDTLRMLVASDVRSSKRKTVHPSSSRRLSFLRSIGRFLGERCQRGSSSTASMVSGNAKSMLNDSTANCGVGASPAARRVAKKRNSFALQNVSQVSCRVLAQALRAFCERAALCIGLRKSGLASIWRRTASWGDIGSILHCFMRRIRERVLIPTSAVIFRYVACSSTYRRRSQVQMGSPSRLENALSQTADSMRPCSCGDLRKPRALARCWIAPVVRPSNSLAISAARMFQKLDAMIASSVVVHLLPMFCSSTQFGNSIHQPETNVKWLLYDGPVYNLAIAEDESYIAGNVIVHNCTPLPITVSWRELGIDVDDVPLDRWDAKEWFGALMEDDQRKMFNNGKLYEAWKEGDVGWDHLSHVYDDAVWGDMRRQSTFGEAMEMAGLAARVPARVEAD